MCLKQLSQGFRILVSNNCCEHSLLMLLQCKSGTKMVMPGNPVVSTFRIHSSLNPVSYYLLQFPEEIFSERQVRQFQKLFCLGATLYSTQEQFCAQLTPDRFREPVGMMEVEPTLVMFNANLLPACAMVSVPSFTCFIAKRSCIAHPQ